MTEEANPPIEQPTIELTWEDLEMALDDYPGASLIYDRDTRLIAAVNSAFELTYGWHRDRLIGQRLERDLVPARFAKDHPTMVTSFFDNPSLRTMKAGNRPLVPMMQPDGSEKICRVDLNGIGGGRFAIAVVTPWSHSFPLRQVSLASGVLVLGLALAAWGPIAELTAMGLVLATAASQTLRDILKAHTGPLV